MPSVAARAGTGKRIFRGGAKAVHGDAGKRAAFPQRTSRLKSEEEIAAFNEEAAAYSGLLAVAKEEAAQLSELKAKTYTSWAQITLEDARPFLAQMIRNADRD